MTTTPSDDNSMMPASPYGPAAPTSKSSGQVPPVVPPEPVPPIAETPPVALPPLPVAYGVPAPPLYYSGPAKPSTTLSMLSMIFGIASFPLSCCWGFGFLLAVAGIVLGHLARKKEVPNRMSKAGLIISYIVAGLSIAVLVIYLAFILLSGINDF